ncbi:MAG: hypothetical protein JWM38_232 [Sphingomonas bacterium]|jgi:copper(I)-binding protein|nr:hypothetical protein [Sphingomonas bacterium]MDB5683623.1 hypothetical protein [Sphingomonas bacterium]MDB5716805.1 hypothetical protein [Sphingomonas bacterium]
MRRAAALAFLALAASLAGCNRGPEAGLAVEDAWVRLPAVAGRPGAGYFTLRGGPAADRMAAIDSPSAARAELHQGGKMDGMMTMRPINGVDLPSGGRVAFAPEGDHVMLFGIDPAIKPGGTMRLQFRFRSGETRQADARVVAAGDPAPSFAP